MKNTKTVTNEVNKPKKPIKKSIIIALILIAALVPTILGVASYIINTKNILDTDEMSVSLFYKGKLLKEATDDPKDQNADLLVHLFDSIIYKMEKLDSPPEILSENTPYTLRIATSNSTNDYVCHFNLTGDSYFVDSSQNVYKIDKENAEVFLTSEFAEILYVNAIPPKLYSSSDEIISPTSHKWNYKNVKGEFVEAAEIKKSESVSEYNMSGSLGLDFDSFPDKCFVKVLKSGIYVYEGDINELSSFFVEPGATLQFEVEATWNQKEDTDYHGVVNYSFKAIVRDRAEFHLDKHEVTNGDYILASCVNVLDSSKIEFYSVPDIKCEPIFFNDNGIVRTLIPFSQDLEAGEYKLFFSYGATEESLSIVLNEPEAPKKYIMKPENIPLLSNLINEKNIKEIDSIIYSLEYDKNIYLRNSFIDIADTGATVITKYGTVITTGNNSIEHKIFGTQYSCNNNCKNVPALNYGRVVNVGNCAYLGRYVIIDHGLGLKTIYAHLESIFVSEGDIIARGEVLGLAGSQNIVSPSGVFVMCYVYDIPIDIDNIGGKTLPFYYPDIKEEE